MKEIFTQERVFTQSDFDSFAALSQDFNPIHIDEKFAQRTHFGRTVAHGIYLYSILFEALNEIAPIGENTSSKIIFPAPCFTNTPMIIGIKRCEEGQFVLRCQDLSSGQEVCLVNIPNTPNDGAPLNQSDGKSSGNLQLAQIAQQTRIFNDKDILDYYSLLKAHGSSRFVPKPLINAVFSKLLGIDLPGLGTNYLKQETTYFHDAIIGEKLNFQVKIMRLRISKKLVDLETICHGEDGRIIANGRALVSARDVKNAFEITL